MNPSASGWIPKYLRILEGNLDAFKTDHDSVGYHLVRKSGFVYGLSKKLLVVNNPSKLKLTNEERSKVNLFHLLLVHYIAQNPDRSFQEGVTSILKFYVMLGKKNKGFHLPFLKSTSDTATLENIFSSRIHASNSLIKKNFTSILTNAFLYIDVLAYGHYLASHPSIKEYTKELEGLILHTCLLAINSKHKKNKFDKKLLELFEETANYVSHNITSPLFQYLEDITLEPREKYYLLDMACIAVWDDHTMDASEQRFLFQLCEKLGLTDDTLAESIENIVFFNTENDIQIKLFNQTNPVNQVYKQATKTVKILILRNQARLITELEESGELLVLLGKSTTRDLNNDEKHKVKEQLLDICKTIPSLTIFLLPGGSLLLPILVKLIPQLLPSAFDDNRIKK